MNHHETSKKSMLYFGFLPVIFPKKQYPTNWKWTPSRQLLKSTQLPQPPTDPIRNPKNDTNWHLEVQSTRRHEESWRPPWRNALEPGMARSRRMWIRQNSQGFSTSDFFWYGFWKLPYRFTNVFTISCGNALYLCMVCLMFCRKIHPYIHYCKWMGLGIPVIRGCFLFWNRKMFWMVKMIFRKHASFHFLSLMKKIH